MRPLFSAARRAISLLELMVTMVIMLLIVGGIYALMSYGLTYYQTSQATLDLQQQGLQVLQRLGRECSESSKYSVLSSTSPQGVMFASPRDAVGSFWFDEQSTILWQRLVAYYVDNLNQTSCLLRKEMALPSPTTTPPQPAQLSLDVATLRANSALPPRVMARFVDRLTATPESDALLLEIRLKREFRGDFLLTLRSRIAYKNS